ncbi:MAG: TetR/AcrR family transcriptional regulator [Gammaproteobacteria bacterium]|nr:TetR/AcrR family transcriptional regulator [Gammaproteobacteria bacterium]MCP4879043.1 TetR/AcrR family transcriptional regulator [Gammaproteobacteria bacterium]MDP6165375.1 TetR/AcrR family transcriptional regulator [Gammaproteobacteria bacterium]
MNWGIAAKPKIPEYFPREKESRKVREFKRREEEILASSLLLFKTHGEDKITVEVIADSVGIGKGTIYKHFKSKSDIYLRLLENYELDLRALLDTEDFSDPESIWRSYFGFRMGDPEQAILFARLEEKLVKDGQFHDVIKMIHDIRSANMEILANLVDKRIDSGKLEQVPAYFHLSASWALVHGALALHQSDYFRNYIEDQEAFFEFLLQIGMRMGNRGQSGHGSDRLIEDDAKADD